MKDGFLEQGDVIELKAGHRVYATVMWKFANRKQAKPYHNDVDIADYPELAGEYVVERTSSEGGGTGHGPNDIYPDGHHVYCKRLDDQTKEVDFFQSGCFTATIEPRNIRVIGKATRTISPWVKMELKDIKKPVTPTCKFKKGDKVTLTDDEEITECLDLRFSEVITLVKKGAVVTKVQWNDGNEETEDGWWIWVEGIDYFFFENALQLWKD